MHISIRRCLRRGFRMLLIAGVASVCAGCTASKWLLVLDLLLVPAAFRAGSAAAGG